MSRIDGGQMMLLLTCPWCGPRDEAEFRYGGEAGNVLPTDAEEISDRRWAEYLYVRNNPRGPLRERWMHRAGCRQWFTVTRNTATNEIVADAAPRGGGGDA
jgi:sarcosine oxidase subunit alpha/sarcosine oxidase subunit delta